MRGFLAVFALAIAVAVGDEQAEWTPATDYRSAEAQIADWIPALRMEIAARKAAGDPAAADWQKRLDVLIEQFTGKLVPRGQGTELHCVGVYHGKLQIVTVKVTHTATPVALALSSYHSVEWRLELAEGVRLERVILGGYNPQTVVGAGNAQVTGSGKRPVHFYCFERNARQVADTAEQLRGLTGLELSTVQGEYTGKVPFEIGPGSPQWRKEYLLPDFRKLVHEVRRAELQEVVAAVGGLRFETFHVSGDGTRRWHAFTVHGPVGPPLGDLGRRCTHAIRIPNRDFLTVAGSDLVRVGVRGGHRQLRMPPGLPALSWACGLALDTKRNRALLASLGGEGVLYAWDLDREKWSLVASMENRDVAGLVYDAQEDALYALENDLKAIYRIDPKGKLVQEHRIAPEVPPSKHPPRLVAAGRYLILITDRAHVLDAKTGRNLLSFKLAPR